MATEQKKQSGGLKEQLTILLHEALMPMKELLGEKKYTNRIRKAVKIITEGIEKKNKQAEAKAADKEGKKLAAAAKKAPETVAAKKPEVKKPEAPAKKAAAQKTPAKKTVAPKTGAPKPATPKKAAAAKAPVKKAPARPAGKSK